MRKKTFLSQLLISHLLISLLLCSIVKSERMGPYIPPEKVKPDKNEAGKTNIRSIKCSLTEYSGDSSRLVCEIFVNQVTSPSHANITFEKGGDLFFSSLIEGCKTNKDSVAYIFTISKKMKNHCHVDFFFKKKSFRLYLKDLLIVSEPTHGDKSELPALRQIE